MTRVRVLDAPPRPETEAVFTTFQCSFPGEEAFLVGDFNHWDPRAHRMVKKNGAFHKKLKLAPGIYEYKFIVDGQWRIDPYAAEQRPNEYGSLNSVVRV
jgi:1,4-alpha-glucan branching enzyme